MTALIDTTGYRALFEAQQSRVPPPGRLQALRREAFARFETLGFPSTRMEDWKYTSVSPIAKESFVLPEQEREPGVSGAEVPLAEVPAVRLVFLDGRWNRGLSGPIPEGAVLLDIAEALDAGLAAYADCRDHAFTALNTAVFPGGAFLDFAEGSLPGRPIHIVHLASPAARPTLVSPRTFIRVGSGASVRLIETYAGGGGIVFTNAVTEIVCGENAVVDHSRVEIGGAGSLHVATTQVAQAASSVFRSTAITLGGRLVRTDLNVLLSGTGAEAVLNGCYMADRREHVDNHTRIDHQAAHTRSRELYAGVLAGRSKGVFNGAIVMGPDAGQSVAGQQNRNLLLSDDAVVNSKPELQIHTDDIKCTHGATIGQLDRGALFYLRTRGFDLESARRVLTEAFVSGVLGATGIPELEAALNRLLRERLAKLGEGEAS